jgi:hypothetical protein
MTMRGGPDDVSAARNAGDYAHLVCHGSRRRRRTGSSKRPQLSCAKRSCAAAAEASGAATILVAVAAALWPVRPSTDGEGTG